uniref:Uncharacterized protein n=1 Tax=Oryza brachyantha TaxID=4533 RepID=J3N6Y8_ORYBR
MIKKTQKHFADGGQQNQRLIQSEQQFRKKEKRQLSLFEHILYTNGQICKTTKND